MITLIIINHILRLIFLYIIFFIIIIVIIGSINIKNVIVVKMKVIKVILGELFLGCFLSLDKFSNPFSRKWFCRGKWKCEAFFYNNTSFSMIYRTSNFKHTSVLSHCSHQSSDYLKYLEQKKMFLPMQGFYSTT